MHESTAAFSYASGAVGFCWTGAAVHRLPDRLVQDPYTTIKVERPSAAGWIPPPRRRTLRNRNERCCEMRYLGAIHMVPGNGT